MHAADETTCTEDRLGKALQLARIGLIFFLVAVVIAVLLQGQSFSITGSYLSKLGCFRSPFDPAAWLFTLGLAVFGGSLFWLFHVLQHVGPGIPAALKICANCTRGAGIALVIVGATPVNMFYRTHVAAMSAWLVLMASALIGWLNWVEPMKEQEGASMARYVTYAVCVYPVACLFSLGPLLQKFIAVMAIGWLGYVFGQIDDAIESGLIRAWSKPRTRKKRSKPTIRFVDASGSEP